MKRAPISCCFIVRDDPLIVNAIASIRPWVEEIVVIQTKRELTPLADVDTLRSFTGCNDENGEMDDFALARNHSFSLASQPWVMWLDSDDEISGGEHLLELTHRPVTAPLMYYFPYEYDYDSSGAVKTFQNRERLVSPRTAFHWVDPIHETIMPIDGLRFDEPRVVVKHRRKHFDSKRNLRILLKKADRNNPRHVFYLAQALMCDGQVDESLETYERYLEIAWWSEEKVVALLEMARTHRAMGRYEKALECEARALSVHAWGEVYFSMARTLLEYGEKSGEARHFEQAVHFAREGIRTPLTNTKLFVDRYARRYDVYDVLNRALGRLGDYAGAIEACDAGLAGRDDADVPGTPGGNLVFNREIYRKLAGTQRSETKIEAKEKGIEKMKIVFACGDCWEDWNPKTIAENGMGGSETAVAEMAKRLAALGHEVFVYTSCGEEAEYDDGVAYRSTTSMNPTGQGVCDLLIVWRNAWLIDQAPKAKVSLLWVHDVFSIAERDTLAKFDRVLALSEWHKRYMLGRQDVMPGLREDQIVVTSNGIDLTRFAQTVERNAHKIVFSSSPDRGLAVALECWPRIRAEVPDAELHVFYGFDGWHKAAAGNRLELSKLHHVLELMEQKGIVMHGRVDQKTLAREMLSAGVWILPTWFCETSCISAMEAQAAGLRIVASKLAALEETVADRGELITEEWNSPKFRSKFVQEVVHGLTQDFRPGRAWLMDHAKRFAWDGVVEQWLGLCLEILAPSTTTYADPGKDQVYGVASHTPDGRHRTPVRAGVIGVMRNGKEETTGAREDFSDGTSRVELRHANGEPLFNAPSRPKPTLHMILTEYATGGRPIDPVNFEENDHWGGGCRAGFMGLVKAASEHFHVTAFSQFAYAYRDAYRGGVDYLQLSELGGASAPDVVLAYYDTTPLQQYHDPKTLRIASHHTYLPPCQNFDLVDVNVAPSDHAMRKLKATWDPLGDWDVLPNAIPESLGDVEHRPVSGRVIYHTSPDRGLADLFKVWSQIRSKVPHATLHVIGDVDAQTDGYYSQPALARSVRGRRSRELRGARDAAMAVGGVTLLGTLSRARVLEELSQAACFAFPCSVSQPCETFSISIMECIRIGVPVVLRPADALWEIYDNKIVGWADEFEWQSEFVDLVSEVLYHHRRNAEGAKVWAAGFTFECAAENLRDIVASRLKKTVPVVTIPKYVPVPR